MYGLAYCGGIVGAESVCLGLFDENPMIARNFFIGGNRSKRGETAEEEEVTEVD